MMIDCQILTIGYEWDLNAKSIKTKILLSISSFILIKWKILSIVIKNLKRKESVNV